MLNRVPHSPNIETDPVLGLPVMKGQEGMKEYIASLTSRAVVETPRRVGFFLRRNAQAEPQSQESLHVAIYMVGGHKSFYFFHLNANNQIDEVSYVAPFDAKTAKVFGGWAVINASAGNASFNDLTDKELARLNPMRYTDRNIIMTLPPLVDKNDIAAGFKAAEEYVQAQQLLAKKSRGMK